MRLLPIHERARRHSADMGIQLTPVQLKLIYKRNKVRFRQPKVSVRLPENREMALVPERILFAERMKRLLDDNRVIVYTDEATFQATAKPGKTWMAGQRLVAPRNL